MSHKGISSQWRRLRERNPRSAGNTRRAVKAYYMKQGKATKKEVK